MIYCVFEAVVPNLDSISHKKVTTFDVSGMWMSPTLNWIQINKHRRTFTPMSWWQAESVGNKKRTLCLRFEQWRGLVAGKECGWQKKDPSVLHFEWGRGQGWLVGRETPPSHVSSEGGNEGLVGGQTVHFISYFEWGRGAGVSTESSSPPSHISSERGEVVWGNPLHHIERPT